MKIIHFSTHDILGGAAKATYRLHSALLGLGLDSRLFVGRKNTTDSTVECAVSGVWQKMKRAVVPSMEAAILSRYRKRRHWFFSPGVLSYGSPYSHSLAEEADIVCMYWINSFLSPSDIRRIRVPIVWRLSDMWPFTGGCHYSGGCQEYEKKCGRCPMLGSTCEHDITRFLWSRKRKAWKDISLTVVAPSRWLADCAKRSSLFKSYDIRIIPTGVDTDRFQPMDKNEARLLLNLPKDKKLLLFGAESSVIDERKGFRHLIEALRILEKEKKSGGMEIVIFGASAVKDANLSRWPVHCLGNLQDELSMKILYSAADVFMTPSIEDNLPNTVLESMACGTPCAAFRIGGMPDVITHKRNGYLADPYDASDIASGISWLLENSLTGSFGENCRAAIMSGFTLKKQAESYSELYRELAGRYKKI